CAGGISLTVWRADCTSCCNVWAMTACSRPSSLLSMSAGDEHRDELPADLDAAGYVGPYAFPNVNRRRVPGTIYLVIAVACLLEWVTHAGSRHVLVNRGFLGAAVALGLVGAYHLFTAWDLRVSDMDALAAAVRRVGFPVGHASAQLAWRGLRSRPTWRLLVYSAENPPGRRGPGPVGGGAGGGPGPPP